MPYESSASPVCPRCGEALRRIRRSFGDRVLSLVSERKRYRCKAWGCGWEGCLKTRQPAPSQAHAAGK